MISRPLLDPNDVRDPTGTVAPPHTRMISEFIAAEHQEIAPNHEPVRVTETEPHGMFWFRSSANAMPVLKAHEWFYRQVAATADAVLAEACQRYGRDKPLQEQIAAMSAALREYIDCRKSINDMSAARKFKQEADDAAYQLCQSAKYVLDAHEKTQFRLARGEPIDSNEQIARLRELSETSLLEGYVIAQAVIRASPEPMGLNFELASRRVVDYSCRKLTEWFAARRQNQDQAQRVQQLGAALDLSRFFQRIARPGT